MEKGRSKKKWRWLCPDLSTALEGTNKDGGATVQTSRLRSRGQKEMFRCQVEPFDCAQDRLRRNLFDTQGWLIVSSHVQRPLDSARGDNRSYPSNMLGAGIF